MSTLAQIVSAYRSIDPPAWVGVYRLIPVWAGIVLVLIGLALLTLGGGRPLRLIAGPVCALSGALWARIAAHRLGIHAYDSAISVGAALGLGATGLALPPLGLFVAVGLPAGLLTGELVDPSDWLLGFTPSFVTFGALAAVFYRYIGAVLASIVGAWLTLLGLLAAVHQIGSFSSRVAAKPLAVLGVAAVLALCGSILQVALQVTEEQRHLSRAQKEAKRKAEAERLALERRWTNYSQRRD